MADCVPCVGKTIRQAILKTVDDRLLYAMLESVPDCEDPLDIEFCRCTERKKRGGAKREPSEYQKFVSVCMKEKHIKKFGQAAQGMKECAAAWRARK